MDRDSFIDVLKKRYADDIHDAYMECEHQMGTVVDFPKLATLLKRIMKSALSEGLSASEFHDLVESTLPEVKDKLDLNAA